MTMVAFDKTFPVFESSLNSSEMRNNFNALFNGDLSPLRPRASDPLAMTVYVNATIAEDFWLPVWHGFDNPLLFAGDDSPAIVAPDDDPRIDLLTIDSVGTLAWTTGEEGGVPVAPDCPGGKIPICYVYCKTTMTKIVNFEDAATYPNDGYIYRDLRPFLNLGAGPVVAATNFQSYKKELGGDGSDGDVVISVNTTLADSGIGVKVMEYDDLTVNAGIYLESHANDKVLVLLVKGTLTLNGTIRMNGRGGAGGAGGTGGGNGGGAGSFGGGGGGGHLTYVGGGGGGLEQAGQPGTAGETGGAGGGKNVADYLWSPTLPFDIFVGKGGNGAIGNAEAGIKLMSSILSPISFESARYLYGSGGGEGGGQGGGPDGGAGGGVLWIEANEIVWGGSGLLSANGIAGGNGQYLVSGGAGGGAGGFVQLVYKTKTGSSTIQIVGGVGGAGSSTGNGGAGAAGVSGEFITE